MVCVHNVVAASAVAGLIGKEGDVIRKTFVLFVYYALLAGSVVYSIVWYSQKGLFNGGTLIAVAIVAVIVAFIRANSKAPDAGTSSKGDAEGDA